MPQMELRPLHPVLKEKAQKEINEEPNRIASDISAIRYWLEKQAHLKSVNPCDQWIVSFLRGNKYSLEKTKSKLDMYYTLRTLLPEIFCNRNPFDPIIQGILKLGIFLPLTTLETEGSRRICLHRLNVVESSNYRLIDVLKVVFMIIELLILEDDNFVIAGEIFCNRNPFDPIIQGILKLGIFLPLTTLETEGSRRICLHRLNVVESSNYRLIDVLKVVFMIIELLILEDDNFVIAGEDLLVDLNGVGIQTFSQWTPTLAKQTVAISEKALPVRMKSTHLLRTSNAFESVYSLFRMLISEKWKKRFNVYSQNFEAMYDVIPRTILPKEYGGVCGTIQELTDYWKAKVESHSDWYLREELVRSDESLRLGQPKTGSDLFGVEGSFRKLNVD